MLNWSLETDETPMESEYVIGCNTSGDRFVCCYEYDRWWTVNHFPIDPPVCWMRLNEIPVPVEVYTV